MTNILNKLKARPMTASTHISVVHQFNEFQWVATHADIENPSEHEVARIDQLRVNYPELKHWCGLALNEAWGWYSQDCWLVGMLDIEARDPWFLGYIYQVEQGHRINSWDGNTQLAAHGWAFLSSGKSELS